MEFENVLHLVFVITVLLLLFSITLPILIKQSHQMTCLENGYFDYDGSIDSCYDLGKLNVDEFDCVKEGKCKGRHYSKEGGKEA